MKFDEDKDELIFSSGRRAYAFDGILGLNIHGYFEITYGSDGHLNEFNDSLDQEDLIEMADYMIRRWQAYRQSVILKKI